MSGKKSKKQKKRDEVMLLHLKKTINCGPHKSKKDYDRNKEKQKLRKQIDEQS